MAGVWFYCGSTALGTNDVNYVLIPEIPFALEVSRELVELKKRLAAKPCTHSVLRGWSGLFY
jgi:hypothetical protein